MLYTSHGQPMPGTPVDPDIISYISSECSGVYSCLQCQAEIRKNFNVDHPNYKKFWDAQVSPVAPSTEEKPNKVPNTEARFREVFGKFGFDEFMSGQIIFELQKQGLISLTAETPKEEQ